MMWPNQFLCIFFASSSLSFVVSVSPDTWSYDCKRSCSSLPRGSRRQRATAAFVYSPLQYRHQLDGREQLLNNVALHRPRASSTTSSVLGAMVNDDEHDDAKDINQNIGSDNETTTTNKPIIQSRRREEWIDGKQMMQILAQEKAEEEQRRKELKEFQQLSTRSQQQQMPSNSFQNMQLQSQQNPIPIENIDTSNFVTQIGYTDANTLEITIPSSGLDSNTIASGAFSAVWFSVISSATVSMLSAGALPGVLFMAPFWLAGGVVAKTAVYDPFISSTFSIGQYLWTLEKKYLGKSGIGTKNQEGSTESLKGAAVELAMVVNGVGRYQLRLFVNNDGNDSSITFGNGLRPEELEYVSRVINDHLALLKNQEVNVN